MKKPHPPLLSTPAWLWDGQRQLPGTLELWELKVVFRSEGFSESHLNLVIPIWEILQVEEFLLYDLARNGLRIEDREGKTDYFVLEEPRLFRQRLEDVMKQA